MKLVKRLIPIMLSLILVLTMLPTGAFATVTPTPTGSLTINDGNNVVKDSSLYAGYQIVTWDSSTTTTGGTSETVYTNMVLNSTYKPAIVAYLTSISKAHGTDAEILTSISALTGTQPANLAYALKAVAPATAPYNSVSGIFTSLPYGYYLVIETANNATDGYVISKPILVCIPDSTSGNPAVIAHVKTEKATIEKKIVENNLLYDSSTAAIGEIVYYQSTSSIPTYPTYQNIISYFITDTCSTGLTYNSTSTPVVKIVGTGYTQTLTAGTGTTAGTYSLSNVSTTGFKLTLNNSDDIKTWGNAGYKLLVTYNATVNANAQRGSTGNPNTVTLTYSTFPDVYSTSDTVITYTAKLIITKKGNDDTTLQDATFKLEKYINGSWAQIGTEQTTNISGQIEFTTLQQGKYRITETVAPTGYNLDATPVEFTITATNTNAGGGTALTIPNASIILDKVGNTDALTFKATWSGTNGVTTDATTGILGLSITDTKGFTLPGTGGIGTTIFTVGGIAILLLGIFMVLVYTKKRKAENER